MPQLYFHMSKLFGTFPYVINLRNTRSARDFSGLVRQKTLYPHFSFDRETSYTVLSVTILVVLRFFVGDWVTYKSILVKIVIMET